ncbi:MAG: gliding motility-associated C-terminal domain-containing protein, partial [Flavobacteriales bacterium]
VFTPNGDGDNDLFLVQGVQGASYDLKIYDRWGDKVFNSNTMGLGWNGRRDNDDGEVPDGTYFVIVTYKEFCSNDPEVTHTGHVTLLR